MEKETLAMADYDSRGRRASKPAFHRRAVERERLNAGA